MMSVDRSNNDLKMAINDFPVLSSETPHPKKLNSNSKISVPHSQTSTQLLAPPSDTNSTQPGMSSRKRSNSKSLTQPASYASNEKQRQAELKSNSSIDTLNGTNIINLKKQYSHSIKLTLVTLNETFEKKTLIIPFAPESLKLGRPANVKVAPSPDNGYFDSRVLSRNHAAIFADPESSKIYIEDLGSSNGTYVNDQKILPEKGSKPVELHIDDRIDLGFNIEMNQNHKRISARVDDIAIMPIKVKKQLINLAPRNEDILRSFDTALFGDLNPDYEDALLDCNREIMSGIFNNANISNAPSLEVAITTILNEIQAVKEDNLKLKSIDNFLSNFQRQKNQIFEDNELKWAKISEQKTSSSLKQLTDQKKSFSLQLSQAKKVYDKKIVHLEMSLDHLIQENQVLSQNIEDLNYKLQETIDKHKKDDLHNSDKSLNGSQTNLEESKRDLQASDETDAFLEDEFFNNEIDISSHYVNEPQHSSNGISTDSIDEVSKNEKLVNFDTQGIELDDMFAEEEAFQKNPEATNYTQQVSDLSIKNEELSMVIGSKNVEIQDLNAKLVALADENADIKERVAQLEKEAQTLSRKELIDKELVEEKSDLKTIEKIGKEETEKQSERRNPKDTNILIVGSMLVLFIGYAIGKIH